MMMVKQRARQSIGVAAVAFGVGAAGMAFAADAIEEITVTARKRAESLQDVSVSVQVVRGEDLVNYAVTDLGDLSQSLPAVNIVKGGASDQLYVRGIGSGFNSGFEQAVGTYIDGVYLGRSRGARSMMVDLDRVEVLKGPQSAFFGNSSIAGALNLTSASPEIGAGFYGHTSALASFHDGETNFEGALNVPVGDRLALRLAARKYDMDGYYRNTHLDQDGAGQDDLVFRVGARWEPTDVFDATLKYARGTSDRESPFAKEVVGCDAAEAGAAGVPAGRPGPSCVVNAPFFDNELDWDYVHGLEDFSDSRFSLATLEMNWSFDGVTLTSITGRVENRNRDLMDLDSGPYSNFVTNQYDELDQWSQELRLTSEAGGFAEWMVGVYYQDGEVELDGNQMPYFIGAPPLQAAITAAQASGHELGGVNLRKQDETTESAFAAVTLNLTPVQRLGLGLRWIRVEKTLDQTNHWALYTDTRLSRRTRAPTDAPFAGFLTVGSGSRSSDWSDLLPSVTYEWDFSPDAMFYASFSQGFKAGGFDFSSRDGSDIPEFDEETVDAYEIGVKSRLLNGRLILNASAFYSDYEGVQQSVLDPDLFVFSVSNAAASSTRGIEVNAVFDAGEHLTLAADATFMDAQFDDFLGACSRYQERNGLCSEGFQDLSDHETTFAPSYSGTLRAEYRVPVGNLALGLRPELYFTDGYYLQADFDPFTRQGSYEMLNMRMTLSDLAESWEVALVGRNLTDEKVLWFANDLPGSAGSYMQSLQRGRSVSLQGTYRF